MNKEKIFTILNTNQDEIKAFGVSKIGLFGSFVRSEDKAKSDIDLLVEFNNDMKTFDNFMALSFLLDELFEQDIELITEAALSPYIGPYILQEVEYVSFGA